MSTKRSKQYSEEFKQDAVNYYLNSAKTLEKASRVLKISKSALSKWTNSVTQNNGEVKHLDSGNYSSDAEKEDARLRKELKDARH